MKINKNSNDVFNKILNSEILAIFVLFLVVTNLLSYLGNLNYAAILLYLILCFIINTFTSNMSIILGISLIVTNIFVAGSRTVENLSNRTPKKKKSQVAGGKFKDNPQTAVGTGNKPPWHSMENFDPIQELAKNVKAPKKKYGKNGIIGPYSFKNNNLEKQQLLIKENIEKLQPLMDTANKLISTLPLENLSKLIEKMNI